MRYADLFKIVVNLKFDEKQIISEHNEEEIYLIRPSILPKKLKNKYDVNKNFQIWLKIGKREFKPNHMRVLIDLNLRARGNPELKQLLFESFDEIFQGTDSEEISKKFEKVKFNHSLNTIKTIIILYQLFLIEQEYNYTKESKYEPKTLFLQGWVRQFIDNIKEIDNLCMSVVRGQPPAVKYTYLENKKHKKYSKERSTLWYLD